MKSSPALRVFLATLALTLLFTGFARAQRYAIGVNDHFIWRGTTDQDVAFQQYNASGTKFVRVDIPWFVIETPSKGSYNATYLARMDHFFQQCAANGIRVIVSIAYAPSWANGGHTDGGRPPTNPTDFADFCEWFLRRYAPYLDSIGRPTLEEIELWNEPDLCDLFFKGYARDAAAGATAYGNMVVAAGTRLQTVRAAIGAKDVMIGAPVISDTHGPCWAPAGTTTWMDAFYAVPNVTKAYDIFAWHSYWTNAGTTGWLPPELPPCWYPSNQRQAVLGKLLNSASTELWAKMVAHGDSVKPNWCSEIGGACSSSTPNHSSALLSFAEQQTHMADAMNVLTSGLVTNLHRLYWYQHFDDGGQSGSEQFYGITALNATNPITYSGFIPLSSAVFTPKLAYSAYHNAFKGAISFADNFDDGTATAWTATANTWHPSGGAYVSPHNAATGISYTGSSTWLDYTAYADFKFTDPWKTAGMIARYNGTAGYYLRIDLDANTASRYLRLLIGTNVVATATLNGAYNFLNSHELQISVRNESGGVRVLGFIDGTQYINYLDTAFTYQSGTFALRAEPWTGTITVDNVVVMDD
ncbi:hypothetical protein CfE428DRAFT_1772 [Chthoniobacter flavus Ellin428]|uniref:Glycoside hydrolase family 5 domain-containing protein n=1 Tax=Chthoniobacter flavus Ellin428 TaxID=497964 RepID=B4CYN4_9BACT|nr:cellulase family glycosylhydrolase [Chthoniobacter flavus]EDY20575.1 hypothetical protein CfE428DRAFT_1772 [Chthoniobacter flavus Ellin428]TCO89912.1 cellulase (glycosyl hydrolase family 5) [Chthoniobacter flavus]